MAQLISMEPKLVWVIWKVRNRTIYFIISCKFSNRVIKELQLLTPLSTLSFILNLFPLFFTFFITFFGVFCYNGDKDIRPVFNVLVKFPYKNCSVIAELPHKYLPLSVMFIIIFDVFRYNGDA